MFFMRFLVIVFLIMIGKVACEEPHYQTAFIGNAGDCESLWSYSDYSTDHFWNKHGKKLPTFNHFFRKDCHLYAECALNFCNSLFIHGGYAVIDESLNGHCRGVEDIEMGWKWLIHSGQTSALTSQLMAIIPAGRKKSSIRYGEGGAEFSLLYSDQFFLCQRSGWYDLALGYRHYTGFPSDQIRSNVALGYNVIPRLHLIVTSDLIYGLWNGNSHCNFNNVTLNPNFRLLKGHIECVVNLCSHISISFGAYRHLWGRNVGTGGGWFGGLWIDF